MSREHKTALYEQLARIGKALATPTRLELLDLLCQRGHSVEELAEASGLSVANTSHHLQVLKRAQLATSERQGTYVVYRVADLQVAAFFGAMRGLAGERLAELSRISERFARDRGAEHVSDQQELVERVRKGAVTLIDVRPLDEFAAGHLPGAISVPLPQLRKRLAKLPKHKEVVAYCRGPYCVMAMDAVTALRKKGYKASRLEDGVAEWLARGYGVERQSAA